MSKEKSNYQIKAYLPISSTCCPQNYATMKAIANNKTHKKPNTKKMSQWYSTRKSSQSDNAKKSSQCDARKSSRCKFLILLLNRNLSCPKKSRIKNKRKSKRDDLARKRVVKILAKRSILTNKGVAKNHSLWISYIPSLSLRQLLRKNRLEKTQRMGQGRTVKIVKEPRSRSEWAKVSRKRLDPRASQSPRRTSKLSHPRENKHLRTVVTRLKATIAWARGRVKISRK